MRYILPVFFSLLLTNGQAQKYALLDQRLAQPISYTDRVTAADKNNSLFPVEKKMLPQFVKALEEIAKKLSSAGPIGAVPQYVIGCTKFKGFTVELASGDRLDYIATSTCENVSISMHVCDAKSSNATNAFFINTFVKYIAESQR